MTGGSTAARTIKDIRGNKVRMYLKELEKIRHHKEKLAVITTAAKLRRIRLTGKEWGEAQREAVNFNLDAYLV